MGQRGAGTGVSAGKATMVGSTASGWYYLKGGAAPGQQVGPLAWDALSALGSSGSLAPLDLVWHPGQATWVPASQVPGLIVVEPRPVPMPPQVERRAGDVAQAGAHLGSARSALAMILDPGRVMKSALQDVPWPFCLSVSGLAFAVFFLQTALDMHRAGTAGQRDIIVYSLLGLGLGTIGVLVVAGIAWSVARAFSAARPFLWTVRAFGLAYSATLIYALIGIILNLAAGWNTGVAFGITGALWAFYPLLGIAKELTGDRLGLSLVLTTVCGGLVLSVWAVMGT
jgi:hypothetical protein